MRGESLEDNNPENLPESSLLSLTNYEANTRIIKQTFDLNCRVEMKEQGYLLTSP